MTQSPVEHSLQSNEAGGSIASPPGLAPQACKDIRNIPEAISTVTARASCPVYPQKASAAKQHRPPQGTKASASR